MVQSPRLTDKLANEQARKFGVVVGFWIRLAAMLLDLLCCFALLCVLLYFLYLPEHFSEFIKIIKMVFYLDILSEERTALISELGNLSNQTIVDLFKEKTPEEIKNIHSIILFVFCFTYFSAIPITPLRTTPGKYLFGLYVIDHEGYQLGFWRLGLRFLSYGLSPIIFMLVVWITEADGYLYLILNKSPITALILLIALPNFGYLMILISPYKQGLHDYVLGTAVVQRAVTMKDKY